MERHVATSWSLVTVVHEVIHAVTHVVPRQCRLCAELLKADGWYVYIGSCKTHRSVELMVLGSERPRLEDRAGNKCQEGEAVHCDC